MPEIQNELHLSGSQPDIERLISSIMTPSYQMIDFARILPVPDELASLPAGMSRVKIDCYLTAVNPNTADYRLEKLPADEYDRLFRLSRNITVTTTVTITALPETTFTQLSAILLTEKEWQIACESSERQTGAIGVIRTGDS